MGKILNIVGGASIGLFVGIIVVYAISSGNISNLQVEIDDIDTEKKDLEVIYSDLLTEYEDLKRQQFLFSREKKILTDNSLAPLKVFNITAAQYEFTPDLIEVDLGDIVVLRIWSTLDKHSGYTKHGFLINPWLIDEDLPEKTWTTIIFVADKPGEHYFVCSRDCGVDHVDMVGRLIVH